LHNKKSLFLISYSTRRNIAKEDVSKMNFDVRAKSEISKNNQGFEIKI
jgi:hypothetical protein